MEGNSSDWVLAISRAWQEHPTSPPVPLKNEQNEPNKPFRMNKSIIKTNLNEPKTKLKGRDEARDVSQSQEDERQLKPPQSQASEAGMSLRIR